MHFQPNRHALDEFMPAATLEGHSVNKVILVVEDHPIIRMSALDLVHSAGFDGVGAQTADEAISILEARSDIRLVFTDVEMPGTMDGIKLAHYIRDRWPPVLLIVASGKVILEERQLPSGARFFPKPYDEAKIVGLMKRMIDEVESADSTRPKA